MSAQKPISISEGGCKQDWDAMQAQGCGRYCQLCERVVIDFTNKTSIEVKEYLRKNPDTCGSFYAYQLMPPPVPPKRNFFGASFMLISAFFSTAVSYVSAQSNKPAMQQLQNPRTLAPVKDSTERIVVGKMQQDKTGQDSSKKNNSEYKPKIIGKPMFGQDTLPMYELTNQSKPDFDSSVINKLPPRIIGMPAHFTDPIETNRRGFLYKLFHRRKPD